VNVLGNEDVFKRLHFHFTWMLKAGALTYSETLHTSGDMLRKLCPQTMNNSIFNVNVCDVPSEECLAIRELENILSKAVFRVLLYCTLTGVKVSTHLD
jgi:hypothetical protein